MPRRLTPLPFVLLAVLGCDPPDPPPPPPPTPHPVRGQVVYADKPAAGVQVTLVPSTGSIPGGPPALPTGVTGPDGTFKLSYIADGDGAPPGSYQVVLNWPGEDDSGEPGPDRLLGWYDVKHSQLAATVKEGDNTLPPFKLPEVSATPPVVKGVPGRN